MLTLRALIFVNSPSVEDGVKLVLLKELIPCTVVFDIFSGLAVLPQVREKIGSLHMLVVSLLIPVVVQIRKVVEARSVHVVWGLGDEASSTNQLDWLRHV